MKIALCSIPVSDPHKAFKFYTEVLGFIKKLYIPEASLAIVASSEDPEGTSALLEPIDNPINKNYQEALYKSATPIIVFETRDIQKEFERLKKLGVNFKKDPIKTEWGIEAIFDDTCGNLIQLIQI